MSDIMELVLKLRRLEQERNEVIRMLTDEVLHFKGSVQDALRAGLVRLNFPAPPGFYRMINREK